MTTERVVSVHPTPALMTERREVAGTERREVARTVGWTGDQGHFPPFSPSTFLAPNLPKASRPHVGHMDLRGWGWLWTNSVWILRMR